MVETKCVEISNSPTALSILVQVERIHTNLSFSEYAYLLLHRIRWDQVLDDPLVGPFLLALRLRVCRYLFQISIFLRHPLGQKFSGLLSGLNAELDHLSFIELIPNDSIPPLERRHKNGENILVKLHLLLSSYIQQLTHDVSNSGLRTLSTYSARSTL